MRQKIFITLIGLLCALSAFSERAYIDGVLYNLNLKAKTAEVTGTSYYGEVTIPSSITHKGVSYRVTSIEREAFYNCPSLRSVTIPNSVTSIGDHAFENCTGLTSVTIPNSVSNIGDHAFDNCQSLKSITIPNSVTSIGYQVFSGCTGLTSITISSSVTEISSSAFIGCIRLTSINVAAGNLYYCSDQGVLFDKNKTTLIKYPSDKSGSSYSIPNSVTSIGKDAFVLCDLTSVTIPNSVTSIGKSAFSYCKNLTSVTIPNSVTSIGESAFSYCKNLTSVTIPNSVTSIGEFAFSGCDGLTSIEIPNSVTSIGKWAFSSCTNLTSVTIPNSVTSIGRYAFYSCTNLTSVTIPSSVKSIGEQAFSRCSSLTSVTIPSSVTNIGNQIFYDCDNLKVRAASSASLANAGIPADRVIRISEEEALAAYAKANPSQSVVHQKNSEPANVSPYLRIVDYSVTGCGGSSRLEKKRPFNLQLMLQNTQYGKAENIVVELKFPEGVNLIEGDARTKYASLEGGKAQVIDYEIVVNNNYASNQIPIQVIVKEKYGKYAENRTINLEINQMLLNIQAVEQNNRPEIQAVVRQKISEPANLTYVDGSLQFTDATGNKAIDANETCHIRFKIRNDGKGEARNCKAKVTLTGSQSGITVQTITVPTIAPQKSVDLDIPVSANMQTKDGNATFTIEITEPNGFGTDPMELTVATKAFVSPYLRIVDYSVTSSSGTTKLEKKKHFNLQLLLQNTQYGKAENVEVELKIPENVFLVDGDFKTTFASMEGGKAQSLDYEMVVNNNYASNQIPVQVILKEKYGKYAESRTINLEINQMLSSSKLNIRAVEQNNRPEIQLATIGSDVDKDIPETDIRNDNTFVLIIANEHYNYVENVPFAINDGNIFREYCIKTLGINEKQILYIQDATGGAIRENLSILNEITTAFALTTRPHVIIYYAGHGIPDEASKTAYLLPVDVSTPAAGFKLDNLYATLGKMPASQITVFMDACFSGSKRDGGALDPARGVALRVKSGIPQGKMVVFSAAQGDETAYPNREQQHGMFTYYLLKKLKETEGNISLKQLGDYVTTQVRQQSVLINRKSQTPCVIPSAEVGTEWQTWTLK